MSIDLGAIESKLESAGSGQLNDELATQTPSGENVFSKAFGSGTNFFTKTGGLIRVRFIFNPQEVFGQDSLMASMMSDYSVSMRRALTKLLVAPEFHTARRKVLLF